MFRFSHPLLSAGLLSLLTLLFVAACGAPSGTGSGGSAQQQQEQERPEETGGTSVAERSGNPTLGAADAPVLMIEWGDFQ